MKTQQKIAKEIAEAKWLLQGQTDREMVRHITRRLQAKMKKAKR